MLLCQCHLGGFQLYSFLLFSINCKIFLYIRLSYFSLLHLQILCDIEDLTFFIPFFVCIFFLLKYLIIVHLFSQSFFLTHKCQIYCQRLLLLCPSTYSRQRLIFWFFVSREFVTDRQTDRQRYYYIDSLIRIYYG